MRLRFVMELRLRPSWSFCLHLSCVGYRHAPPCSALNLFFLTQKFICFCSWPDLLSKRLYWEYGRGNEVLVSWDKSLMVVLPFQRWHEDYSLFRKVSVYLLTGLELFQKGKYVGLFFHWHCYWEFWRPRRDTQTSQPEVPCFVTYSVACTPPMCLALFYTSVTLFFLRRGVKNK